MSFSVNSNTRSGMKLRDFIARRLGLNEPLASELPTLTTAKPNVALKCETSLAARSLAVANSATGALFLTSTAFSAASSSPSKMEAAATAVSSSSSSSSSSVFARPAATDSQQQRAKPSVRRAKTAFMFYSDTRRSAIKAENPSIDKKDLAAKIRAEFDALPADQKLPFEEKWKADVARVEKIKQQHEQSAEAETPASASPPPAKRKAPTAPELAPASAEAGKKRKKDPNQPKRPHSAFALYSMEMRSKLKSELPDLAKEQVAAKIKELWAAVDSAEKLRLETEAAEAKSKWNAAMEEYKKQQQQQQ